MLFFYLDWSFQRSINDWDQVVTPERNVEQQAMLTLNFQLSKLLPLNWTVLARKPSREGELSIFPFLAGRVNWAHNLLNKERDNSSRLIEK
jgi:hypothetical protein